MNEKIIRLLSALEDEFIALEDIGAAPSVLRCIAPLLVVALSEAHDDKEALRVAARKALELVS